MLRHGGELLSSLLQLLLAGLPVGLQLVVKRFQAYAKSFGGSCLVVVAASQRAKDDTPFDFIQRHPYWY